MLLCALHDFVGLVIVFRHCLWLLTVGSDWQGFLVKLMLVACTLSYALAL